ncbi:MAG TPA: ParB/RepB/Spo0J family partition protein [Nitratifractor sp.]|nr:ParB/RepB/Spo0J family partition protein [Nitratifractor sp.]
MAKTGLGRGLGDILEEIGSTYESQYNEVVENEATGEVVAELPIDEIEPNPYQPRKHFDEEKLKELSESIRYHGLLQPIVVIAHEDRYILIAGERRLRASKLAKFETIKALIATVELDELRLRELALIENIQRENLNPIELALSYKELLDVHAITHEQLSEIVHKSRPQITNTLRLLSLSEYLQDAVAEAKISQGHAKILVGLEEKEQKLAADTIIGQKLSVRESEKLIQKIKNTPEAAAKVVEENRYAIPQESIDKIKKYLPFNCRVKKQSVEILLPNGNELEEFIEFIKHIR